MWRLTEMANFGKKRVAVGLIIVIAALAGIVLRTSYTSHARTPEDIARAVAKAVYSNDAGSLQRLFGDGKDRKEFVSTVSPLIQRYGPVKEVVLLSKDRILLAADGSGERAGPDPSLSTWKVVAERGSYPLGIEMHNGRLSACNYNLGMPIGGISTGTTY